MVKTRYMVLALVVTAVITAMLVVLPRVHYHGSVSTYSIEELLSGVPIPTVCIVGYATNPYIGNLTTGLGKVGVPYTVTPFPP